MTLWTNERVDLVKQMLAEGASCRAIATAIGGTRGAVIGKIHRLGLQHLRPGRHAAGKPKRRTNRVVQRLIRSNEHGGLRMIESVEPEDYPIKELPAEAIPLGQRKQLFDLATNDCRWPYGDPGKAYFFFCGGIVKAGCSYCKFHYLVSRQPTQPSRLPYIPGMKEIKSRNDSALQE